MLVNIVVDPYYEKERYKELKKDANILAEYDKYVIADIDEAKINSLKSKGFKVEIPKLNIIIGNVEFHIEESKDILTLSSFKDDFYIMQFIGPVKNEWINALEKVGVKFYDYVEENTCIVRISFTTIYQFITIKNAEFIRAMTNYISDFKLSSRLKGRKGIIPLEEFKKLKIIVDAIPFNNLGNITVIVHDSIYTQQVASMIEGMGGKVVAKENDIMIVAIEPSPEIIQRIVDIMYVKWVEPYKPPKLCLDKSASIINATTVRMNGLDGSNEIVAVADTGLDTGDVNNIHQDFQGKVVRIFALGRPNDASDPAGHGTHVAGTVLGNGTVDNSIKGIASGARLVFQSVMDANGFLSGLPPNLCTLFNDAYNVEYEGSKCRIHSNSWGSDVKGQYTLNSKQVDQFVWDHKDMVIVFAAGNEGVDSNNDGIVEDDSIDSPGSAKNCITVGASENNRPGIEGLCTGLFGILPENDLRNESDGGKGPLGNSVRGRMYFNGSTRKKKGLVKILQRMLNELGYKSDDGKLLVVDGVFGDKTEQAVMKFQNDNVDNDGNPLQIDGLVGPKTAGVLNRIFDKRLVILTYRRRISRFITNPLADDQIADNVEGLVAFSSRGPVDGNRIKPDIIAPGTSILATKSSRARDPVTDGVSSNPQYMFLSGTSMATPHIAGSAAIVRQYLKQLFSHDKDNKKWRKKARLQDPGPTAALIKAMLVHGAVKLKGQYDPAHNDSGGDVPNNHQGFGRVDLKQSLFPDAFMEIYDGHSLLKDEEREYRFLINSNKSEFKGTLVWTDLPNCNLVNKLELKVSDTNAQQRLSEQYNNNVQKFVIDKPNNGIYKVSVKCTNISSIAGNDGQDYALIVTGDITATLKAKSIDIMEYPKQKRLLDPVLLRNESDGGKGPLGNSVRGRMYFNGSTREKEDLVKILQIMLNELGYKSDDGKLLVVDGVFGDKTEQAVMKFQNDNKDWKGEQLKIDGLVGPLTSDALNRAMVGIWYPMYQTDSKLTNDIIVIAVTKDALNKEISLDLNKAKKIRLIMMDRQQVKAITLHEPDDSKFSFEGEGKYTIFDKDGTAIADGRIKDDENIILPKDFDFYAVELKVSNTIYTFYKD